MNDVCEVRVTTPCFSMDTVPHSTLHTCTHSLPTHNRPRSHTVPSPLTPHTAPGLHECMHAHTCPLGGGCGRKGVGGGERWAWQEGEWGEERGGGQLSLP